MILIRPICYARELAYVTRVLLMAGSKIESKQWRSPGKRGLKSELLFV